MKTEIDYSPILGFTETLDDLEAGDTGWTTADVDKLLANLHFIAIETKKIKEYETLCKEAIIKVMNLLKLKKYPYGMEGDMRELRIGKSIKYKIDVKRMIAFLLDGNAEEKDPLGEVIEDVLNEQLL